MKEKDTVSILFFGTAEFAIPSLDALTKVGHPLVGVVTKPDEPAGRKLQLTPPPVKKWAVRNAIPVFQPARVEGGGWRVEEIPEADLFIIAAYGKIIPREIFEKPKHGTLNIHPSLLPRWRGPSPIQYTILNGDAETGVTIIKLDDLLDHGPIISQTKLQAPSSKLQYSVLHDLLAKLGAELLIETLPRWIAGDITPTPQDESQATWSHKISKDDGRINWEKPAEEIERMVRAFTPWPGAWTVWNNVRIRIDDADANADHAPEKKLGCMRQNERGEIFITTGTGNLLIRTLTPEGKKTMDVSSFIRGHQDFCGSCLS